MKAIAILIIGVITIFAVYFQIKYFENWSQREMPISLAVALIASMITVLGCTMWGFIALLEPNDSFIQGFGDWIGLIIRSLIFSFVLIIKAVLSPMSFAVIISNTIYHWVEYQKFELFPVFSYLIQWLLNTSSSGLGLVYTFVVTAIAITGSIESIVDN